MFYCDECANERGWPESGFRSKGPCEVCGRIASCYDVPSKYLPYPKDADPKDIMYMWENHGDEMAYKWLLEKGLVEKI